MAKLFDDKLHSPTAHHFHKRDHALNETVYRAPGGIGPLTTITHIPFIYPTHEDEIFRFVSSGLAKSLRDNEPKLLPPDGEFAISKHFGTDRDDLHSGTFKPFLRASFGREWANVCATDAIEYVQRFCEAIDQKVMYDLCSKWPEYFIFGSVSQIIQQFHFELSAMFAQDCPEPLPGERNQSSRYMKGGKLDGETKQYVIRSIRFLASWYYRFLNSSERRSRLQARIEARIGTFIEGNFPDVGISRVGESPDFGGIISAFRQRTELGFNQLPPLNDTFESDYLSLRLKRNPKEPEPAHLRLRWYRSNQFWDYTLIASYRAFEEQNDVNAFANSRRFTVAEQGAEALQKHYQGSLDHFLDAVLDFVGQPSLLSLQQLHDLFKNDAVMGFPGKLLAGANYICIPAGILAAIMFFPQQCIARAAKARRSQLPAETSTKRENFVKAITELRDPKNVGSAEFDEFQQILRENYAPDTPIAQSFLTPSSADLPSVADLLMMGTKLLMWTGDDQRKSDQLGRILAKLTIHLWLLTGIDSRLVDESPIMDDTYQDFCACYCVDRRAIYVTNFLPPALPKPETRFTRTMLIDLNLTGYQRGRLADRACNIATFRSLCVRDSDRVRTIVRAIEGFREHLNVETWRRQKADNPDEPVDNLAAEAAEISNGENWMTYLKSVEEQLDGMNLFVTYGIRGRYLSVQAYFERIENISKDLRQDRIPGFPQLSDFLERRVSRSIGDIRRMSDLHGDLRQQVQDMYRRERTRFSILTTKRQVEAENRQVVAAESLISHTVEVKRLTQWTMILSAFIAAFTILLAGVEIRDRIGDRPPNQTNPNAARPTQTETPAKAPGTPN